MNHIPFKEIAAFSRVAVQNWQNDRAPRMGAALAYYIALSLAPTVVILLAIAGLAFGAQAARANILTLARRRQRLLFSPPIGWSPSL
jgi:membrane protein